MTTAADPDDGAAETERRDALVEDREARLLVRNAVGKVRGQVLRVLDLEVEQLRGYLDRPEPNVAAAVARLRVLDSLREDLRRDG